MPNAAQRSHCAKSGRMRFGVRVAFVLLTLVGCGSKSGLSQLTGSAAGTGASGGGGGTSAAGGASTGGTGGSAGSGGSGGTPVPDCIYAESGPPQLVFTWVDGVRSPLLATLAGGSVGKRAEIAIAATHEHFWHPDIRVAKVSMGADGLSSLTTDKKMTGYGVDSHATGHLVRAEDGALDLLYYHGDEANASVVPGIKFRTFNTNTWTPLPEVTIEDKAGFAYDIAVGPSVGPNGNYAGAGRFIAWRSAPIADNFVETRVAVIDASGKMIRGPVVAAGPGNSNQFGAAVAWTGAHYLVATNEYLCTDDILCSGGITVSRFAPGAGSAASLGQGIQFAADPALRARTPQLSGLPGGAFVAWRELGEEAGSPQTLRVARLGEEGAALGPDTTYSTQATAGPILHASDQGAVVLYSEAGDSDGPEGALGHTVLWLQQHGKAGHALQSLQLPTTALTFGTPYAATAIDAPRGLLVAWTGQPVQSSAGTTSALYLSFLRCQSAD